MLLNILDTIKKHKLVAHQHLVRLFATEDGVIENIANILCGKKLIVIEQRIINGCNNLCNTCHETDHNYNVKNNCYYKII